MDHSIRSFVCGARRNAKREKRNRLTREKERVFFFPLFSSVSLTLTSTSDRSLRVADNLAHPRRRRGKYDRTSYIILIMRILDAVDSDACALILISEWTSANGY